MTTGASPFIATVEDTHPDAVDGWDDVTRKPHIEHSVTLYNNEHWGDIFVFQHSVLPKVIIPALVITVWSTLVCVFYLVPKVAFLKNLGLPNSTILVTILGTAMSLLLVFRVNTAYDRFWEGRKLWSTIHYQLRNLGRLIWVYAPSGNEEEMNRKIKAMHLLVAFAASTKHSLRNEPGHRFKDVGPFIEHIPDFSSAVHRVDPRLLPIPMEISFHLQIFINKYLASVSVPSSNAVSALVDSLCSFQRIRETPVPMAYTIHLKQTLFLYLLSLPFQLIASPLQWATIPVVFFSSLIMLGIEVIGGEIENPFGLDPDDLPQDEYCDTIRDEIDQYIKSEDPDSDSKGWITPCSLAIRYADLAKLNDVTSKAIEAHRKQDAAAREHHGFSSDMLVSVEGMVAKVLGARHVAKTP